MAEEANSNNNIDMDAQQLEQQLPAAAAVQQQQQPRFDVWNLSEDELEWAWALKIAVEADDELKPLSDFEVVQQALFARENTEEALARCHGLQAFREEYNIHDTPVEGVQLIEGFMAKHPGFLLSIEMDEHHGHFVFVYDYAKRRPNDLKTDADWRAHLGGMYYMMQCQQINIHACREGVVHIIECEGMIWDNFSYEVVQRNFAHLYHNYPLRHKEASWLRTPTVANVLFSLIKPLIGPEVARRNHLGCSFHGYDGRIDELFLRPTPEVAMQNLLMKILGYLAIRYDVQQSYKLPDLPLDGFDNDNIQDGYDNEEEGDEEEDDMDMDMDIR